jgi:glucose-6-phosphate isomerase
MLERVTWQYVADHLTVEGAAQRFVAITEPGSKLEQLAQEKNYRFILHPPTDLGGRYSALSVYGLFPLACVGINIEQLISTAARMEQRCAADSLDNPALQLACFIYDHYRRGRDKISLIMPKSGAVFGLWLEQLIAESLGKQDIGVLPNVEIDPSNLHAAHEDRMIISYALGLTEGFEESLMHLDPSIPALHYRPDSVDELFDLFVLWEFTVALVGLLMEVNPFDQPNVEDTKKRVRSLLLGQGSDAPSEETAVTEQESDYREITFLEDGFVRSVWLSRAFIENTGLELEDLSIDLILRTLLGTLRCNDYFALNAFLPFRGYGRREALERIRDYAASRLGVAACLEIGPRYLHSIGQFHKGGPNTGVYCFLSADEDEDIKIPGEEFTLGMLATTQAQGDFLALAARGRRAIQIHLASNDEETLSRFADRFCLAVCAT